MNEQRVLELSTLIKWINGEPLSYFDMERFIELVRTKPLSMSSPSPDELANLKAKLLSVVQQSFFTEQDN